MPSADRRSAAYTASVEAAISAAPPISAAERERLSRVWRASGFDPVFPDEASRAA